MFPAKQRHELMPRGNPETRLIVRTLPGQIPIRGDDLQPVGKIPDMLAMIDFRRSFRHGADQRPNKMLEFVITTRCKGHCSSRFSSDAATLTAPI